jgi:hypothetical protein
MRIYLDACCVNRLTDDQSQPRIRQESEAVERILGLVRGGKALWLSSDALIDEIERGSQIPRKSANRALFVLSTELIEADRNVLDRARQFQSLGYGAFDSLHLASAEAGRADALLTTDDKFIKRASRGDGSPQVLVQNPILWLEEVSL